MPALRQAGEKDALRIDRVGPARPVDEREKRLLVRLPLTLGVGLLRQQDDSRPALRGREQRRRQTLQELAPAVGAALALAVEEQDERPTPGRVVVARYVDEVGQLCAARGFDSTGEQAGRGGWLAAPGEER